MSHSVSQSVSQSAGFPLSLSLSLSLSHSRRLARRQTGQQTARQVDQTKPLHIHKHTGTHTYTHRVTYLHITIYTREIIPDVSAAPVVFLFWTHHSYEVQHRSLAYTVRPPDSQVKKHTRTSMHSCCNRRSSEFQQLFR